jgi:hypothetical protein
MPFFVEKLEEKLVDAISAPEGWIQRNPAYAERFDAIAEMRNQHQEQGTRIKTPDWKHVASIIGPLSDVQRFMNPYYLKDKRAFYGWLDRNPEYCVYDRRRGRRMP